MKLLVLLSLTMFACSVGGVLGGRWRGRDGYSRGPAITDTLVFVCAAVTVGLYHGIRGARWISAWLVGVAILAAAAAVLQGPASESHSAPSSRANSGASAGVRQFFRAIGDFQARLLLTIFYFTAAAPFGLKARLFGNDPLGQAGKPRESYWATRADAPATLGSARKQF